MLELKRTWIQEGLVVMGALYSNEDSRMPKQVRGGRNTHWYFSFYVPVFLWVTLFSQTKMEAGGKEAWVIKFTKGNFLWQRAWW